MQLSPSIIELLFEFTETIHGRLDSASSSDRVLGVDRRRRTVSRAIGTESRYVVFKIIPMNALYFRYYPDYDSTDCRVLPPILAHRLLASTVSD